MGMVYVAYVFVTFWVSRHDEPVHADVARHEVPMEEGIGETSGADHKAWPGRGMGQG